MTRCFGCGMCGHWAQVVRTLSGLRYSWITAAVLQRDLPQSRGARHTTSARASRMSRSRSSRPLADRLARACWNGDLPSAKAAVGDGASVHEEGTASGVGSALPLAAAVFTKHNDVVVWLLSHGADPNGDRVMTYGARYTSAAILQLLIDAGGDVNRKSGGELPLFTAVEYIKSEDRVRVLLAQPALNLTVKCDRKTPEQWARDNHTPALADMIAQEVSGKGWPFFCFHETTHSVLALLWLAEGETSDAGTTTVFVFDNAFAVQRA